MVKRESMSAYKCGRGLSRSVPGLYLFLIPTSSPVGSLSSETVKKTYLSLRAQSEHKSTYNPCLYWGGMGKDFLVREIGGSFSGGPKFRGDITSTLRYAKHCLNFIEFQCTSVVTFGNEWSLKPYAPPLLLPALRMFPTDNTYSSTSKKFLLL